MENKREMARDETSVQPKPRKKKKKKKKRFETKKFFGPVHEGRRGPEATREKKKREMKKRNEMEMAEDRLEAREEAREEAVGSS